MALHGLFGIALKTGIYGREDAKAVLVEVVRRPVRFAVLSHNRFQFLAQVFAEMRGKALRLAIYRVVEPDGPLAERLYFLLAKVPVFLHLAQHHIAALQCPFRVFDRMVEPRALQGSNQQSRFFGTELLGRFAKKAVGRYFHAIYVVAERHRVQV